MKPTAAVIKCRELIGRLKSHGIQASRPTLPTNRQGGPDALLVADDGRAWLTVLWAGTTLQPQLLIDPTEAAVPSLDEALAQLIDWRNGQRQHAGEPTPQLLIIAPSLESHELPLSQWQVGIEAVPVLARPHCRKADLLAAALLSLVGPVLPASHIDLWRARAVPEVKIDRPVRRKSIQRDPATSVAPLLLDYNQERCARIDLEQDADARRLIGDLTVRVITGVAGCGKTLVLVHRAALLTSHFQHARVLIVSHNRPLIEDLKRRVKRFGAAGRVECKTFYQWLQGVTHDTEEYLKPHEIQRWIEKERESDAFTHLSRFSSQWLIEEMGWIFDFQHADDSYLTVVRKGRGIPLSLRQRREMLALTQRFRAYLRHQHLRDWTEHPLHVAEQQRPALRQPAYDHILIDEAQFFAPVWLRLLTAVLKPGGHLFLCADPTQGFLRRRTSWAEIGLDVRNRSTRLEKPYRSTRAILEFARNFYRRRLPEDDEPLNLPSPEWMQTIEPGLPPIIEPGGSRQDQLTRILRALRDLQQQGTPLADVLILTVGRDHFETQVVTQIKKELGQHSAFLMKASGTPDSAVGVAHLMAATGLERPIVFLIGVDDLAATERDPSLQEEERADKIIEHTRLIYVGLTRAMERLVIYSSHAALQTAFGQEEITATCA